MLRFFRTSTGNSTYLAVLWIQAARPALGTLLPSEALEVLEPHVVLWCVL